MFAFRDEKSGYAHTPEIWYSLLTSILYSGKDFFSPLMIACDRKKFRVCRTLQLSALLSGIFRIILRCDAWWHLRAMQTHDIIYGRRQ